MGIEDIIIRELGWLGSLARRYYRNDEDARDLVGDTVCRMMEHKDRYDSGFPFRPWAKTVMENIFKNAYARRMLVAMLPLDADSPHQSDSTPENEAESSVLLSLIEALSVRSVSVCAVRLYAVCGLSYKEAATAMGVSVEVVRTRIAVGRRIIKRAMGVD